MLTDAIKQAKTEHVIYFLLTAYVETLDYYDPPRSCIPAHAKRLPLAGRTDVVERLRTLHAAIEQHAQRDSPGDSGSSRCLRCGIATIQGVAKGRPGRQYRFNESPAAEAAHAQTGAMDSQTPLLGQQSLMIAKLEPGRPALDGDSLWSWNVVDRSQHGHERRRRLGWKMTESEAAAWSAANGARLERVHGSGEA